MSKPPAIAVIGTFDSKAEEHQFIKAGIESRGQSALTINVGTKGPSPVPVSLDLYPQVIEKKPAASSGRDTAIEAMIKAASEQVTRLYNSGQLVGIISAGGGTGTHLCSAIMRKLPLGVAKVMVSTVASRDMSQIVATKDIVMFHIHESDLFIGVNAVRQLFGHRQGDGNGPESSICRQELVTDSLPVIITHEPFQRGESADAQHEHVRSFP